MSVTAAARAAAVDFFGESTDVRMLRVPGRRGPILLIVLLLASAGCGRREPQASGGQTASGGAPAGQPAGERVVPASPAVEAAALDGGPRAVETMVPVAPLAATGQMLFEAKGCTGCHTFGESTDAPDLRGVAARRTEAWLRRQITEPEWMAEHDPLTRAMVEKYGLPMTDLDVTPDEAMALLQFLVRESTDR